MRKEFGFLIMMSFACVLVFIGMYFKNFIFVLLGALIFLFFNALYFYYLDKKKPDITRKKPL